MNVRATRARISMQNFIENLSYFRSLISHKTQLCLVVKANAYGHGLIPISQVATSYVDSFAVATVEDGIRLRKCSVKKNIYVMLMHVKDEIPLLCEYNLIPFISHGEFIQDYQRIAEKKNAMSVHLKVDSGMGRGGVLPQDAISLAKKIILKSHVRLQGLCTHFASADEKEKEEDTLKQIRVFESVINQFKEHAISIPCIHAANSDACIAYPQSHYNMVRIGIGAYGYVEKTKPIMNLVTKISIAKKLPKGHKVSYGGTWQAKRDTLIAVLPVGYGDGYSRLLSNKGQVLIDGRLFPVIGRVCMDQIIVDITDLQVSEQEALGKDVLLFGDNPKLNACHIAQHCNTISYEVLTSVAQNMPRDYL